MQHIPVLLHEVITFLTLRAEGVYIDGTLGAAGHSKAIAEHLSSQGMLVACDMDKNSLVHAKQVLVDMKPRIEYIHGNFQDLGQRLDILDIKKVDGIILDLGWNMDQFSDTERGFSFMHDGPLSMTYGHQDENAMTAADIVNNWSEESLADLFFMYADERHSRRIARFIIDARKVTPITTTFQLVVIIEKAVPNSYKHGRIHCATKVFQALRIAVNDELGVVERSLPMMIERLKTGGRLLVITFHSGEDRIVKNFMRDTEAEGKGIRIEKKGIVATNEEIAKNPRARSARLRIFEKI
jgi:16S rRNA (cytosine1402-N4)-methyltransferase